MVGKQTDRAALAQAFRLLRKEGFGARMNFMCCSSCAGAAAPEDRPFVYWHRQNHDSFRANPTWRTAAEQNLYRPLHIGFGDAREQGDDDGSLAYYAATRLVAALKAVGFPAERIQWNGSVGQKVAVLPEQSLRVRRSSTK